MRDKIDALKEQYVQAKSQSEYQAVREKLRMLCDENAGAVAGAALESIKDTNVKLLREKRKDVLPIRFTTYLERPVKSLLTNPA